tara:strand:- start:448 stop:717 length:270 start_codon:yes stop_codon:yes gene_type:complete
MKENIMTKRDTLVEGLRKDVLTINFTKVNGEERVMNCTLNETLLPEAITSDSEKKENLDVIAVWDTDKDAWRSFRVDSVNSIKIVEGVI